MSGVLWGHWGQGYHGSQELGRCVVEAVSVRGMRPGILSPDTALPTSRSTHREENYLLHGIHYIIKLVQKKGVLITVVLN